MIQSCGAEPNYFTTYINAIIWPEGSIEVKTAVEFSIWYIEFLRSVILVILLGGYSVADPVKAFMAGNLYRAGEGS